MPTKDNKNQSSNPNEFKSKNPTNTIIIDDIGRIHKVTLTFKKGKNQISFIIPSTQIPNFTWRYEKDEDFHYDISTILTKIHVRHTMTGTKTVKKMADPSKTKEDLKEKDAEEANTGEN